MPVRVAEDGNHYVLLRADVYERLAEADYDDSPWTAEEMDHAKCKMQNAKCKMQNGSSAALNER